MKLSIFKVNSQQKRQGAWVKVTLYPGFEVKTRSSDNPDYRAAVSHRAGAARVMTIHGEQIDPAVRDEIVIEELLNHCLLDWRGLFDDDGNEIPFARARELLTDPDYRPLADACTWAAANVGERSLALDEADAKN